MGAQASGLRKLLPFSCLQQRESRCLFLGLDAAGKTTVLYKLKLGETVTTIPTIGFNVEQVDFKAHAFWLWDIGGRDKGRALIPHYYPGTAALVFVLDVSDSERLEQARDELHRHCAHAELGSIPLIVLANKQDKQQRSAEQVAADLALHSLARPWHVQPTVASTGEGLHDGLAWLTRAVCAPPGPKAERPAAAVVDLPWDGTDCETLANFLPIQQGTQCPFARKARLWGGPVFGGRDCRACAAALHGFVQRLESEPLDAFVLELEATTDVHAFGAQVRTVLTELSNLDPAGEACMRKGYVGERGWHFRFAGAPFFITSFAPCYPPTSPRFAFGTGRSFLLFQPEQSFLQHNLCDNHVAPQRPPSVRDRVRAAFKHAQRPYLVPDTTRYPAAPFIVRPCHELDPDVRWWVVDDAGSETTAGTQDAESDTTAETYDAESETTAETQAGTPSHAVFGEVGAQPLAC